MRATRRKFIHKSGGLSSQSFVAGRFREDLHSKHAGVEKRSTNHRLKLEKFILIGKVGFHEEVRRNFFTETLWEDFPGLWVARVD